MIKNIKILRLKEAKMVRRPVVAGMFYPAGAKELARTVDDLWPARQRRDLGTVQKFVGHSNYRTTEWLANLL